jgi:2-desacetyl-2-hydroxyethyl bacteriochlorophyllide A dehydrogenase
MVRSMRKMQERMCDAMRIAVMTSDGFRFEHREIPKPGAGEVLIRSISCGICEGEVFRYNQLRESQSQEALELGHEGSGSIAAVGSDVQGWGIGDMITTSLGGAYAEYFVVPVERLVRLPASISPEWAVGEAVACCAYSAQNARISCGDRVAVLGCGFMGLLITAFAKLSYGAADITAVDPVLWRSRTAARYGADACLVDATSLETDSFDIVIEATGSADAIDTATKLVSEHGRIAIVGYHQSGGGYRNINMRQWNYKAIEVTSAHCRRPLWKRKALENVFPLLESGQVDLAGLITPYAFSEIDDAFQAVTNRKEGLIKTVVQFT